MATREVGNKLGKQRQYRNRKGRDQYERNETESGSLASKRRRMNSDFVEKWDAAALKELDDSAIQEKIDHEACIRDGIVKLLAACHEEVQALEASKNLLTINARILALMGLLQRHRAKSVMRRKGSSSTSPFDFDENEAPCKGRLSLSDIRVPLMWTQDDHNKTKTEQRLYYVFCLLKLDGQVLDTALAETDESETDISFDNIIVFENVSHDFKLDIEIYYTVSSDNAANRASGVKRPLRRTPSGHEVPKFILAGHTQLTVDHLHEGIKSHDLKTGLVGASPLATTVSTEDSNMPLLALWGQICCRLAARPTCVEQVQMSGFLEVQTRTGSQFSWCRLWCVLRHATIKCWRSKEDFDKNEPVECIEIKPYMDIADTVSPTFQHRRILILTSLTPEKEPVLASDSDEEYACWRDALRQAILDVTAWKTSCRQEMNIVYPSPQKLPLVENKTLYDSVEVALSFTADAS
ncbi:rhotekin-like isoform X2 [Oculina patagonica]